MLSIMFGCFALIMLFEQISTMKQETSKIDKLQGYKYLSANVYNIYIYIYRIPTQKQLDRHLDQRWEYYGYYQLFLSMRL